MSVRLVFLPHRQGSFVTNEYQINSGDLYIGVAVVTVRFQKQKFFFLSRIVTSFFLVFLLIVSHVGQMDHDLDNLHPNLLL